MFSLKSFTALLALGVLSATAAPQVTKKNTLKARQWTAHILHVITSTGALLAEPF